MSKEIKTRTVIKDIKFLDKAASGTAHAKNAFIKSKEAAECTQQVAHDNAENYAIDKMEGGAKSAAQETADRFHHPQKKAADNVNKAKEQFQKIRQQTPKARKEAAEKAKQTAQRAKETADKLGESAEKAQKMAQEAKKAVTDARRVSQQTRQAGRQTVQAAKQSGRGVRSVSRTTKATGKGTIKTVKKSVKTAERTAKTAVKTTQKTAKAAQQSAKAAAKAAKAAAQTSKAAAKAAAQSAKVATKAVIATVKASVAAIKGLVSIIAAGGWIAVVIIILICVIALIMSSVFGVFFSGEDNGTGQSMQSIMRVLNAEINETVERIKSENAYDELDTTAVSVRWNEVLAVYAVRVNTDPNNPTEVVTLDDKKVEKLRGVLNDMVSLSHSLTTETREQIVAVINPDGTVTETMETVAVTRLVFTLTQKSADEMAVRYGFSQTQFDQMHELLRPEYAELWVQILG
ncbi:MAG: CHAP domain-containing protein [Oscillospiraceae bacterium]|jgi:hypothetical protein|nr:CHAP domain-containing protein [Oscillospiraceae bacterium]